MMVPIVKTGDREGGKLSPLFAGLVYAAAVACLSTILLSLLLALTGLREDTLPVYVYFIHGISTAVGGFVAARRSGEKGWYRGGMLGAIYALAVTLISFLGFDARLSTQSFIFLFVCFAVGAIGGMLGVNTRRR